MKSRRKERLGKRHVLIPDMQVHPDHTKDHCEWIGRYIADKQPDVVVNIGDFADMPSLSTYDMGRKAGEGARYSRDIEACHEGMERLMNPIARKTRYNPEMYLTLGNHEERILRHINAYPHLEGTLGVEDLAYKDYGWEVSDFLVPVTVDGIAYSHYFANPFSGRPFGGSAENVLKNVGHSCVQGHKQTLEVATRTNPITGAQQWSIIAGAAYPYDFDYKGPTGNLHWRGVVMLNEVKDGDCDPMFVSLEYLAKEYS